MSKIIDLTYLNEISGGDSSFIKEMLELYVNTTATEGALFDGLVQNNDLDGINHLAHKMKAPIQMLGASDLFNTIKMLELYGKEKSHVEEIPAMVQKIQEQIELSIIEIRGIIAGL